MKLHRFILPIQLPQSLARVTDPEIVHQILTVLRLEMGDIVIVADGKGKEARGKINEIRNDYVVIALEETKAVTKSADRRVMLCCAILKRENFELVAQKAVEVGAAEILPVITARTVKKGLRLDRLQKIMKEAAEQSGQPSVVMLHEPMEFTAALEKAKTFGMAVLCDETGEKPLQDAIVDMKDAAVFIGPEGGFTPEEVKQAKEMGIAIVTISPFTLRAETAAIIATYLCTK